MAAIDKNEQTKLNDALFAACATRDPQAIAAVVSRGAAIDHVVNDELRPPLIIAQFLLNRPDVVRTLIALGADLEAKDRDGNTVLLRATQLSHRDSMLPMVSELVRAGANVNAQNKQGLRPLDYAAHYSWESNRLPSSTKPDCDEAIVRLLSTHGAVASRKTARAHVRTVLAGSTTPSEWRR